MESNNQNKIKDLEKIDKTDLIYIGVIILLFIIIGFIFTHSTGFIIKNINKIFSVSEETSTQTLDVGRYSLLEKKLELPNNAKIDTNNNEKEEVDTTSEKTDIIVEDKSLLKINIINTTRKDGVASQLSKKLEEAGFSKAKTESGKTISTTKISIKESKKEYRELITKIVKKSYPKILEITNPENEEYDVVIIIGK